MLLCVCLEIDHRWRQNVVRTTKVAHEAMAECVTVSVTYFHRLLQRVVPQSQHSNKLPIVPRFVSWAWATRGFLRKRCNRKLKYIFTESLASTSFFSFTSEVVWPYATYLFSVVVFRCPVTNRLCSKLRKQTNIMSKFSFH